MATTFSWSFPALEYYPHKDGLQQVVHVIHWVLNGSDGTYDSSVYGTQSLSTSELNPDQFVAYDNLTQATVESWLESAMGEDRVQELKSVVQQNIDNMKNPPNVVASPPWAQSETQPDPTPSGDVNVGVI